ncbi:tRNA pseudouridine(38-40) synthase TruA [Desulfovibrio sp. OttesenSCG-928-C06]|nr:tRNA pseudouridine(38-40) synthase TruA [Desulfovibrio sp. OttesenSCG-928-C06]
MARVKMTIAYIGTGFAGWQIQAVKGREQPHTVQGVLEDALADLLGSRVRVHASGRTDSGVHADAQVVHFDVDDSASGINWAGALQRRLPPEISIVEAELADSDFHSRFSCRGKVYTYCLWLGRGYVPPRLKDFAWASGPLDISLMEQAAAVLIGEHDFAGFQNVGTPIEDTVRVLESISHFPLPLPGEGRAGEDSPHLAWRFQGNGFLKQMVRNLMGFLVYAGRGRLEAQDALRVLESGDRTLLEFPTAPACGLSLTKVLY